MGKHYFRHGELLTLARASPFPYPDIARDLHAQWFSSASHCPLLFSTASFEEVSSNRALPPKLTHNMGYGLRSSRAALEHAEEVHRDEIRQRLKKFVSANLGGCKADLG